jgi:predicted enzyme related to lactoylglutathione lyase
MSNRAGLFVYAKHLERMASFYERLLGLVRLHQSPELVVLDNAHLQLLVHAIPADIAAEIEIATPPLRREEAAYKFFFTVPSLDVAKLVATELGGEVLAARWRGRDFVACNAVDPEGNLFQLRESTALL